MLFNLTRPLRMTERNNATYTASRSLPENSRRYSHRQLVAYHEASHVLAALHVGQPFDFVKVIDESKVVETDSSAGRVNLDLSSIVPDRLSYLFILLAGPAATKNMRPHLSWVAVMFSGTVHDYREAWDAASSLGRYGSHLADDLMRTTVLQFVRDHWDVIVTLGDALLAAPEGMLSYQECVEITRPALERSRQRNCTTAPA